MKTRWVNLDKVKLEPHGLISNHLFLRALFIEEPDLRTLTNLQLQYVQMARPLYCVQEREKELLYISPPHYLAEFRRREISNFYLQVVQEGVASEIAIAEQYARIIDVKNGKQEAALAISVARSVRDSSAIVSNWPSSLRAIANLTRLATGTIHKQVLLQRKIVASATSLLQLEVDSD